MDRCNQKCEIPDGADGPTEVSVGFSCKSLSPLNNNKVEDPFRTGAGSTGETAQACVDYVRSHTPPLVVMENAIQMIQPANKLGLESFQNKFNALGYANQFWGMNAKDDGLPQRRKRTYGIAISRTVCFVLAHQRNYIALRSAEGDAHCTRVRPCNSIGLFLLWWQGGRSPLQHQLKIGEARPPRKVGAGRWWL